MSGWRTELQHLVDALNAREEQLLTEVAEMFVAALETFVQLEGANLEEHETQVAVGELELCIVHGLTGIFRFLEIPPPDQASPEDRALIEGARAIAGAAFAELSGGQMDTALVEGGIQKLRARIG